MITRNQPFGLTLFLLLRSSVMPRILPTSVVTIVIATLVITIPFTLIGLPIAFFFRRAAEHDPQIPAPLKAASMIA